MTYVLTLVASDPENIPVSPAHFEQISALLVQQNNKVTGAPEIIDGGRAGEMVIGSPPDLSQMIPLRDSLTADKIDLFFTPADNRRKKLLVADMDSTIIEGESLDDLAAHMALKDKIAGITTRAMNGEIDFPTALRERVMLLQGLEHDALQDTVSKMKLNPGAQQFVKTMKSGGATCVLVTGGFMAFAEAAAKAAGFDHHHGNMLQFHEHKLTGKVRDPILDKSAKLQFLQEYVRDLGLKADDVMAIGDGANDLPMLEEAGLGIGYHPKQMLQQNLHNHIIHGDLTAALYAQGYKQEEFVLSRDAP